MFCPRCGSQVDTSNRYCPTCGMDLTQLTGAGQGGATMPLAAQPPQQESEDAVVREALREEYEIEKELGRGGMAVVYKARDKQLEREVAIKILPFSLSFDAEFVERFQREARTAGKLEHPNIIPIYRVGKSGRVIYFVMKFIRGKSLSGVIESRGAMPVGDIKRMLVECARALGYAHKHGIVHRDIKPDNIMFDELGQAIVTDFGIAKAQSGARLTGTGMSIGTPHYMSPEQARAQNLDGRSDVYSLGVVAYQCLTGHVPFDGEDSFSIGYKHIMEELPVPQLEHADQRELFTVIQRMMAKKPDDRFQTAEDVVATLEAGPAAPFRDVSTMETISIEPTKPAPAKKKEPVPAAPTTPLPRASASQARPAEAETPAPPKPERRRPLRTRRDEAAGEKKGGMGLIAAVLGLIVVGGGGAGYYFGVMRQNPTVPDVVSDSLRAESLAVARADSIRRDSLRAESLAVAAAADSVRGDTAASTTVTTPTSRTGTLALSGSIPRNATVRVDGRPQRGTRFSLAPGSHNVEVAAQGYQPWTRAVTVVAGRTVTQRVDLVRAAQADPTTATDAVGEGTLSLSGVPPSATVTVNGRPQRSSRFKVPAGPATIQVTAQGYQAWSREVTVVAGQTQTVPVVMIRGETAVTTATTATTAPPDGGSRPAICNSLTGYNQNRGRQCFDTRPIANMAALLAPPATCSGTVTAATISVNVSADGQVVTANIARQSNCLAFSQAALSYVQDMTFRPSTKNNQPVPGWVMVPVQPRR